MGCCFGDLSGSVLTFSPKALVREKGSAKEEYSGCVRMHLYGNRFTYDGFPCCSFCCLCGCCRGTIAFSGIHTLEVVHNDIVLVMKDGSKIEFGPLTKEDCKVIQDTYSENAQFLP
mmetsp:Transcript_22151/g.35529  ORF Transcript_22151/g.35529 Transcript_22151/m.35529 type:complete len:116 (-) Transcript_22151:14-361(-)